MTTAAGCRRLSLHCWQQQVFLLDDPWSAFDDLFGRKNAFSDKPLHHGVAHLQFSRRFFLSHPAVLFLEWRDFMISPQASYTARVPRLLLASLVSEAVQDRRDCLVLTYLR